jgi:hypothetical protein
MKGRWVAAMLLAVGVLSCGGGSAFGRPVNCRPFEKGSLLVFPLVDNINAQTILEIVNRGPSDVWLEGIMVTHPTGVTPTPEAGGFVKEDFFIHLTVKEPFTWNTSKPYARRDQDEVVTQLRGYNGMRGFCFVWAVDSKTSQLEIEWNHLIGDAIVYGAGQGFSYNAYAHQAISVKGDRVLNLDGNEYCQGPNVLVTQGFAAGLTGGLKGTLAVCAVDMDFIESLQPEFDINFAVYNQDETFHSRHLSCYQFGVFDLATDLKMSLADIFTPKWQLSATSANPLWAVFFQSVGGMSWGDLVPQSAGSGASTRVVLPPVPAGPPKR